jgi:hypothetical protein
MHDTSDTIGPNTHRRTHAFRGTCVGLKGIRYGAFGENQRLARCTMVAIQHRSFTGRDTQRHGRSGLDIKEHESWQI